MLLRTKICRWMSILIFCVPMSSFSATAVKSMVVFGDSLSDIGNTTHLLKSLRQDENPAYLVSPFKYFIINKMNEFADDYHVPQMVLDAGVAEVTRFFDEELGPMLADLIGKVRLVKVIPQKPYWNARFSNGQVWNEYLATMLDINEANTDNYTNKAFGGSWAMTYSHQLTVWNLIKHPILTLKSLIVGKLIPPSLGITIQAYLLETAALNDESVYFIYSGMNDYLNALVFEDNYNPATFSDYVDYVLADLSASTKKLIQSGARHIVIMGLPQIGDIPKFAQTTDRPVLNAAIDQHNERLQNLIADFQEQYPETDLMFVDTQKFFSKASIKPENYGFTSTTEACIDVQLPMFGLFANSPFAQNYVLQYAQVLQYQNEQFRPGEKNYHVCQTPEHYLFWDDIHPSTRAHYFMARDICKAMKSHGYDVSCKMSA